MKDKELKFDDVKTTLTLGWASYILLVKFLDIDSTEEVVSLFEVELQKPRNLSAHECEDGVFVFIRIKKGEGHGKKGVTLKLWWSQKPMKG